MVPVPVPTFEKVMVPVPVPTFEKLRFRFRFRFQLHIYTIKSKFFLKNLFPFYKVSCFIRKKIININKIYCKMWKKKMINEGNQIHNFISSSGSGTVINYGSGSDFLTSYGSGSTRQKVTVPTVPVPVPQHCCQDPQWFFPDPYPDPAKSFESDLIRIHNNAEKCQGTECRATARLYTKLTQELNRVAVDAIAWICLPKHNFSYHK